MPELKQPRILYDSREKNEKIIEKLKEFGEKENVIIEIKRGGPGDYVIYDRLGNRWGVEYKSFMDCYNSIIQKEGEDKTARLHGQLAELIKEFDGRAIFMLGAFEYVPIKFRRQSWLIKRIVYSFFSVRSLVMPTWILSGPEHIAKFLIKMAKTIHREEFSGRNYRVILIKPKKK